MATDSEILLAINQVLSDYQVSVDTANSKSTWLKVVTDDRMKASEDIQKKLKSLNVPYENEKTSKSSFAAIIFTLKAGTKEYIYFKSAKGGGSGAGAAETKLSESAQALYCALAFHVVNGKLDAGDINVENLKAARAHCDTDETFENMVNNLKDDWVKSCTTGATKLWEVFHGTGNYTFHRGSKTVNAIEKHAWSIIRAEGAFGNLNKWSPADIYMVADDFDINEIKKETTLRGLNDAMWKQLQAKKLIGVSLKKITRSTATMSEKNFPTNARPSDIVYSDYSINADAMDVYLNFTKGRIQFRSFGGDVSLSGWQGEMKGASANQGKISLGPLNYILKRHGVTELPSSNESARLAVNGGKTHWDTMNKLFKKLGVIKTNEDLTTYIASQTPKWRYSKYLSLKLAETMKGLNKQKADAVMEDIYLYASSSTTYSAPYIKLE